MSDFTPGINSGDPDGALRQRLSAAVTEVRPDVSALIDGGLSAGRDSVRRRRRQSWSAAVAAIAVVAAGSAYLGTSDLRSDRQEPTDVGQTEPATPRGLAAAVLSHTESLGQPAVIGGWNLTEAEGIMGGMTVEMGFGNATDGGVELQVVASPDTASVEGPLCKTVAQGQTCRASTLDDGSRVAIFTQSETVSPDSLASSITGYLVVGETQVVVVLQTVVGDKVAPLSEDELLAIATDPMVGLTTGSQFNDEGLLIDEFKNSSDSFGVDDEDSASSSGGGSSSSGGVSAGSSDEAPPKQ